MVVCRAAGLTLGIIFVWVNVAASVDLITISVWES